MLTLSSRSLRWTSAIGAVVLVSATAYGTGTTRLHQGDRWSFSCPANWTDAPPGTSALGSVASPVPVNGLLPNVNIVREPFVGNSAAYAAANITALNGAGAHVLSQHAVASGGLTAVDIETQWPAATPRRTVQRMMAVGGFGYVLTCTVGDQAATARAICDPILATFQVQP